MPSNPISRDAICRKWPIYASCVRDRLIVGAEQYGDQSYDKPYSDLLREIEEELLDVSGWSFILWTRIRELQAKLEGDKDVS